MTRIENFIFKDRKGRYIYSLVIEYEDVIYKESIEIDNDRMVESQLYGYRLLLFTRMFNVLVDKIKYPETIDYDTLIKTKINSNEI